MVEMNNNRMSIDTISTDACTGCKACGDVCPVKAILFMSDDEGYWYPAIDEKKCVECGKCLTVCPLHRYEKQEMCMPIQAYAAWNKDDDERRKATSGGIFPAIGRYVLDKGGYLLGSAYTEDYKGAFHMTANNEEQFNKLKGSKYFQSDTEGIYKETKKCIETGKDVLFVGTPCQVAALYSFLGKRPENLITIDFICRGVSSPLLQKLKIEYYEKKVGSKVRFYRDKYKKYAWIDFGSLIRFENGKEKFVSRWRDEFLHFFIMKNLNIRPSCYECRFKLGHMQSDITVGDFWQIDRVTEKDLRYGVSALMVNTKKGKSVLEKVGKSLYLCKKPLERVTNGNPAYSNPPDRPVEREEFYEVIRGGGWGKALKKYKDYRAESEKQKKYHERRMKKRSYLQLIDDRKLINWKDFLYYNFLCKGIIRDKNAFIIPYKGAVIEIQDGAKVFIKGNVCVNYTPYYPRGTCMATLQVRKNAKVYFDNRLELGHEALLSIAENGYFRAGYLMPRIGTNIVCKSFMEIGENVLLGRDVSIYDSDFHTIYDKQFAQQNEDRKTIIGDNVWFGAKTIVLKGVNVGNDSVVGAGSIVTGKIPAGKLFVNKAKESLLRDVFGWEQ